MQDHLRGYHFHSNEDIENGNQEMVTCPGCIFSKEDLTN
jgi:hypothetical protein